MRVRHDAMGVASWRVGSSLPLRYRNGLSGRERRLINKASFVLDLYDLAINAIGGRDGEQVHLPRGLAGSFETRPRWTTYMSKVDLVVWRRPARAVCEVLMTKFSCFALAAAYMKHVQQVESRSASV